MVLALQSVLESWTYSWTRMGLPRRPLVSTCKPHLRSSDDPITQHQRQPGTGGARRCGWRLSPRDGRSHLAMSQRFPPAYLGLCCISQVDSCRQCLRLLFQWMYVSGSELFLRGKYLSTQVFATCFGGLECVQPGWVEVRRLMWFQRCCPWTPSAH